MADVPCVHRSIHTSTTRQERHTGKCDVRACNLRDVSKDRAKLVQGCDLLRDLVVKRPRRSSSAKPCASKIPKFANVPFVAEPFGAELFGRSQKKARVSPNSFYKPFPCSVAVYYPNPNFAWKTQLVETLDV
jgi:hypothetical protein